MPILCHRSVHQFGNFQGLSDEEVAEAAKTAEAEAAVTSSLVQSSKADASDAQSRYYNLAHRSLAEHPPLDD